MFTADEMRAKPVRITSKGKIFIGDEEVLANYPIADGSIKVEPWRGKLNQLTLTLLVGPVTCEPANSWRAWQGTTQLTPKRED